MHVVTYNDERVPSIDLGMVVKVGAADSRLAGLEMSYFSQHGVQSARRGEGEGAEHTSVAICLRRVWEMGWRESTTVSARNWLRGH